MYEHRVPLADAIGSADLATEVSLTTLRMCLRRSRLPLCACVISAGRACVRACLSLYECYLCVCVCVAVCAGVCACVFCTRTFPHTFKHTLSHTLTYTPRPTLAHTLASPVRTRACDACALARAPACTSWRAAFPLRSAPCQRCLQFLHRAS